MATVSPDTPHVLEAPKGYIPGLRTLAAFVVLVIAFALHVSAGARAIPASTLIDVFTSYNPLDYEHYIIAEMRGPRALFAALVGAALAVAGALMQGITRNPLADPGLFGLLTGASFAVVIAIGVFNLNPTVGLPPIAALGALGAALMVWAIAAAAPGGAVPLTMVLAGAAVSAFLAAMISVIHLVDGDTFITLRVWLTGTLAGREVEVLRWTLPWLVVGFAISLAISRQVTALAMGEETAVGLGVSIARVRAVALVAVVSLSAAAVAIAGPLGFVGLIVPHVARLLVGYDYRAIIPFSALFGATFLLIADLVARIALAPVEVSTGLVTALLGAPFFIWLVRARL